VSLPGTGERGRKRHIAVDTIGLLLTVLITAAGDHRFSRALPNPEQAPRIAL
jgi:hypothetical protein